MTKNTLEVQFWALLILGKLNIMSGDKVWAAINMMLAIITLGVQVHRSINGKDND